MENFGGSRERGGVMQNELQHFGVKGMKWGQRKQRYDASELSTRKKKKLSAEYKKMSIDAEQDFYNKESSMYVTAYNKTVNKWNKYKPDEFNKAMNHLNNADSPAYEKKYLAAFEADLNKTVDKVRASTLLNSSLSKKAEEFAKKYDMVKYDDLAKDNFEFSKELRKIVDGH
jgi:hypothetical protein